MAALQGGLGEGEREGEGEKGNLTTYARQRRRCLPLACQRRGMQMWTRNEHFDVKNIPILFSNIVSFLNSSITQVARALNTHVEPLSAIKHY